MRDIAAGDVDAAGREPGTAAAKALLDEIYPARIYPADGPMRRYVSHRLAVVEAEARQQGRDHGLRDAVERLLVSRHASRSGIVIGHGGYEHAESQPCDVCRALASADGPPEPGIDAPLDVERIYRALWASDAIWRFSNPKRQAPEPRFRRMAEAIVKADAARLSADGDSPGGAE